MINFRVAAKAFIVKDGKLFMMKRRDNDPHKPGALDIPGGRLELGENPYEGVKREAIEETGCDVEVIMPIGVEHFTRDDGQQITLIIFLCKFLVEDVKLSDEHKEIRWVDLETEADQIPEFFQTTIKNYKRLSPNQID